MEYNTYDDKVCWSYPWNRQELDYSICLFNHEFAPAMRIKGWMEKYVLLETS